jgi:hypothetical protein
MSSIWGEGLGGARPVAALSLKSEILGRALIQGLPRAAPPRLSPTLSEASSERALIVQTLKGSGHLSFSKHPTLKGTGHPSWAVVSDLLGPGSGRATHRFRPPPTPVGGGWPKAGRGQSESSQRIRGPEARSKQAVVKLDWATAPPSTVSPSRPVGAPSPKSEILWRASIQGLPWAAPPRLSPTLPEASSERALIVQTLKGSGHSKWALFEAQTRLGGWR